MNFTGKNLQLIRRGLDQLVCELHNRIVTCPDEVVYAGELSTLLCDKRRAENLLACVDSKLDRLAQL